MRRIKRASAVQEDGRAFGLLGLDPLDDSVGQGGACAQHLPDGEMCFLVGAGPFEGDDLVELAALLQCLPEDGGERDGVAVNVPWVGLEPPAEVTPAPAARRTRPWARTGR